MTEVTSKGLTYWYIREGCQHEINDRHEPPSRGWTVFVLASEYDRLQEALQKIAAYNPGQFRPLSDEIEIWKLATNALGRKGHETPAPHHIRYDVIGWLCSVCGGWNDKGSPQCVHTHATYEVGAQKASAKCALHGVKGCLWCPPSAENETALQKCSRCDGSGLALNMAGEPDECPQCKGNAVCAQNGSPPQCRCGCYSGGCERPDGCRCDKSCPCQSADGRP